jgi:hypothetical protein
MGEHATLVKFGQYDHILQLQREGLLYMNCLLYFWQVEDDELRGDPFDGVSIVVRGREGSLSTTDGHKIPFRITNWTLRIPPLDPDVIDEIVGLPLDQRSTRRIRPLDPDSTNLFSMYALRPDAGTFPVDERNFRFGDYALVVTNPQQFIDRVGAHLENAGIRGTAGLVEYMDDDYEGYVGPLRKLRRFAYQSEWRLICYDGLGGPREIRIGTIEDISVIMRSVEVNRSIMVCS